LYVYRLAPLSIRDSNPSDEILGVQQGGSDILVCLCSKPGVIILPPGFFPTENLPKIGKINKHLPKMVGFSWWLTPWYNPRHQYLTRIGAWNPLNAVLSGDVNGGSNTHSVSVFGRLGFTSDFR